MSKRIREGGRSVFPLLSIQTFSYPSYVTSPAMLAVTVIVKHLSTKLVGLATEECPLRATIIHCTGPSTSPLAVCEPLSIFLQRLPQYSHSSSFCMATDYAPSLYFPIVPVNHLFT